MSALCSYCSHLIGVRASLEKADSWKCGAPQNLLASSTDLVTGLEIRIYKLPTCYEHRAGDFGCSKAGNWYEEYKHPVQVPAPAPAQVKAKAAISLADLGGDYNPEEERRIQQEAKAVFEQLRESKRINR